MAHIVRPNLMDGCSGASTPSKSLPSTHNINLEKTLITSKKKSSTFVGAGTISAIFGVDIASLVLRFIQYHISSQV